MYTLANAKIFNGTKMLPGTHHVVVNKNCIESICDSSTAPEGKVFDLQGATLMPGMITGHLHPDIFKFSFDLLTAGIRLGTEFPPGVMMAIAIRTCGVLLESGFTGYLGASCSNHIDSQLKIAIAEGLVRGPRIRACGHHIGTGGTVNEHPKWWLKSELAGQDLFADGPDELSKVVREDIRCGAQTIKIFASGGHGLPNSEKSQRNMSRAEIAAVVESAHERGVKVRAHTSFKPMILECIELGVDIIDHGDYIDEECIEGMAAAGTYWVPSQVYNKQSIAIAQKTGVIFNPNEPMEMANVLRMLPVAHKAGVKILAGDDYTGIFRGALEDDILDHQVGNYAKELEFYAGVDGLSTQDVLSWATKNPGELLVEAPQRCGVIEAGALADITIVDGDPVADISLLSRPEDSLKAVIKDGEFLIERL